MSDFLWPPWTAAHQASLSFTISGVCSNSCPLSQWCHPTISSCVSPFSSCLQSFPASGSFPMSQLFKSRGQSIGTSTSASVCPMNIQDWFPLGWTGWISLQSKGLSRVFSNTTVQMYQFFGTQPSLWSHVHTWLLGNRSSDYMDFCRESHVCAFFFFFNMLSGCIIAFLPRRKHLLISWLQSPSTAILEPQKIKSVTVSSVSPIICYEVMGPDVMILVFWMLSSKPAFSLSSLILIKRLFGSSSISAMRVASPAYLR